MKRIIYSLVFLITHFGYAQTYTIKLEYFSEVNCKLRKASLYGDNVLLSDFSLKSGDIETDTKNKELLLVPNYNQFKLIGFGDCFPTSGGSPNYDLGCNPGYTITNTASEIIKGNFFYLSTCSSNIYITDFKPNVIIENQNPINQNTVCSGEQLELAGFPIGFPDEAYHWQYSVDNKLTWIDVPSSIGSNPKTNNTPQTGFRVDEIIANSEQYFGQTIYFRLGYDQDRPFTDVIPIKYSPCAPVIKDRSYVGPDCNGEKIKSIDAFFETQLMPNESLSPLHLIPFPKTDGDTPKFLQLPVTKLVYDSKTGLYKYSFIIPDGEKLENRNYTIEYQARIINPNFIADPVSNPNEVGKYILRGVVQSSEKFLYEEHEALKFEPVTKAPPLCHNGEAFIELKVTGGAGDYYYTLDNEIEKKFTYSTTSVITTDPITKIETEKRTGSETIPISSDTPHSIKLRDGNNCIDKTAND